MPKDYIFLKPSHIRVTRDSEHVYPSPILTSQARNLQTEESSGAPLRSSMKEAVPVLTPGGRLHYHTGSLFISHRQGHGQKSQPPNQLLSSYKNGIITIFHLEAVSSKYGRSHHVRLTHDLQPQGARKGGLFVPPELPLDPGDVPR